MTTLFEAIFRLIASLGKIIANCYRIIITKVTHPIIKLVDRFADRFVTTAGRLEEKSQALDTRNQTTCRKTKKIASAIVGMLGLSVLVGAFILGVYQSIWFYQLGQLSKLLVVGTFIPPVGLIGMMTVQTWQYDSKSRRNGQATPQSNQPQSLAEIVRRIERSPEIRNEKIGMLIAIGQLKEGLLKANLTGRFLHGIDISNQVLDNIDFNGCAISYSDFSHTDFSHSYLGASIFQEVDLTSANLSHANLKNARFIGTIFHNATLSNAVLDDADLSYTNLNDVEMKATSFCNANLNQANLNGADLTDANFENADLSNCIFSYATLSGVNFSGATLTGANFRNADLTDVQFSEAQLQQIQQ